MKIYLLVWAVVLLALQGCASSIGGKFQAWENASANEAIIYLYRTPGIVGSGKIPGIMFDNESLGPLPRGGYMLIKTRPGSHNLRSVKYAGSMAAWSKNDNLDVNFTLAPGQQLFLQLETYFNGAMLFVPGPVVMPLYVPGGSKSLDFLTIPPDKAFQDLLTTNKVSEKIFEAPAVIYNA